MTSFIPVLLVEEKFVPPRILEKLKANANGATPRLWKLPGGLVSAGESIADAVEREVYEEVSVPNDDEVPARRPPRAPAPHCVCDRVTCRDLTSLSIHPRDVCRDRLGCAASSSPLSRFGRPSNIATASRTFTS